MFFKKDGTPESLEQRLAAIEFMLYEGKYDTGRMVKSKTGKGFDPAPQPQIFYGCWQAYCVDTVDPQKAGRVRFFMPMLHEDIVRVAQLPYALPISNAGGFDDCGMTWPPPAGSRLLIIFEHGDRRHPYYLGTSWDLNRGPGGSFIPGPKREWQKLWAADRARGYLIGKQDGSQVFPPWNTESYNGYDYTSDRDFELDVDGQKKITYPNIYGFKTPGRHRLKFVDGNHNCNDRWKRLELASARQNILMMKDDHLHVAGQWAKGVGEGQKCTAGDADLSQCKDLSNAPDTSGKAPGSDLPNIDLYDFLNLPPKEKATCAGPKTDPSVWRFQKGANPYYKREEECRHFSGPRKIELPQSGIQLQSVGEHQFVMDDSVEEPMGKPTYETPFNLGCSNKFMGRTTWRSWSGHFIDICDEEEGPPNGPRWRGDKNRIRIGTATGHLIEMNDHSDKDCKAKDKRGITLRSTSRHHLKMMDDGNEQCAPRRQHGWPPQGAAPKNKAKNAYIELRSGYGLMIRMTDSNSQEKTQKQNIIIRAPQIDNKEKGPHQLLMQEAPSGPGLVMLLVGGNYYCIVKDFSYWQVGEEDNPSMRYDAVFGHFLVNVEKGIYYNANDLTLFVAKKYILLGAGEDCPMPDENSAEDAGNAGVGAAQDALEDATAGLPSGGGGDEKGPCFFPVIVAKQPWACPWTGFIHYGVGYGTNNISDRVLASKS